LFAFFTCETSVAPLGCVIEDNKPLFIGVSDMLKISTNRTIQLLKSELEIQLSELEEWHFLSLERIFIENKIYRDIEEKQREDVIQAVDDGLTTC
jgi:topoisomerase-4 subunit A